MRFFWFRRERWSPGTDRLTRVLCRVLICSLQAFLEVCRFPVLLSLARMQFPGGFIGNSARWLESEWTGRSVTACCFFYRARKRSGLSPAADIDLVHDIFLGAAQSLTLFNFEDVTEKQIKQIVLVILFGAVGES